VLSCSSNNAFSQCWSFEPVVLPHVYCIIHTQTGLCLRYNSAKGVSTEAKLSPLEPSSRCQLWLLERQDGLETYVIRNVEDESQVLDLAAHGRSDGTPVVAYSYHGGQNQLWKIARSKVNSSWCVISPQSPHDLMVPNFIGFTLLAHLRVL
jgi:hypothetical protein